MNPYRHDGMEQEAHNEGQTDGANHEYHRPYGVVDYIVDSRTTDDEKTAINEAYQAGYENARDQR